MNLIKNLIGILIISNVVISCTTSVEYVKIQHPAMPVEPEWVKFTKQPIIEKIGNTFIVTDQFIEKSAQQHDYVQRVRKWKIQNSVP